MRYLLIIFTVLTLNSCCKEDEICCKKDTSIRFENKTEVELSTVRLVTNQLSSEFNYSELNYFNLPNEFINVDGVRIVITTQNGKTVSTNASTPSKKGCYTYIFTSMDTINVFSDTTLWYQLIKD